MYTDDFVTYLQKEKKMSSNTLEAYQRDLREFLAFEGKRGYTDPAETTSTEIGAFLHELKQSGKSTSTINR